MNDFFGTLSQNWVWQYVVSHLGWVDWFFLIFMVTGMVLGLKHGASQEIPRLFETLISLYLSVEYYGFFSDWISRETPLPEAYVRAVTFGSVTFMSWFILRLLFGILGKIIRLEVAAPLQWIAGVLLGALRFALFFSLVSYLLVLLPLDWLHHSYQVESWSGQTLVQFPDKIHAGIKGLANPVSLPAAPPKTA